MRLGPVDRWVFSCVQGPGRRQGRSPRPRQRGTSQNRRPAAQDRRRRPGLHRENVGRHGPQTRRLSARKLVLIDFWATLAAPCVAELSEPQGCQRGVRLESPVRRECLLEVSMKKPDDARFLVKAQKPRGCKVTSGSDSPVATAYGATAIPATFLIGPDGRILARDLRGEQTRKAIEKALQPPGHRFKVSSRTRRIRRIGRSCRLQE